MSLRSLLDLYLNYLGTAAAAAKSLQLCPPLRDPTDSSPPGFPRPWDSPGKNTGVGCHFLLQCTEMKSESEVTQSCLTLSDPMDCSPPGSSIHGIFQAGVLEWGAIAFSNLYLNVVVFKQFPSISSSIVPFSSCPQTLPASESFPMSQLLA